MDNLITKIREIFSSDRVGIEVVNRVLEEYKSTTADWKEFVTFDPHKLAEFLHYHRFSRILFFRYTRNLVDTGNGRYNLMILCWGPGMGSR